MACFVVLKCKGELLLSDGRMARVRDPIDGIVVDGVQYDDYLLVCASSRASLVLSFIKAGKAE